MKKSVFVVVALMAAVVLLFSSCMSNDEKSAFAVASLKTACKENNSDYAKKYYKEAMEAVAKVMLSAYNDVKTEADMAKAEEEISKIGKDVDDAITDCDCLKKEDKNKIMEELENVYGEDVEKAYGGALERIRENRNNQN